MNNSAIKVFAIICPILFYSALTFAQITRIKGCVKDASTGEPIPFANVYLKGTSVAAITNDSGAYTIATRFKADSIVATFLGYKLKSEKLRMHTNQIIDFNLSGNTTNLDEIVITPGENPAHKILRNIWKNKEKNKRNTFDYSCKVYNKIQLSLSNIDEKFKNRRVMKPFKFVFENVDTNAFTGKTYLPVLITETASDFSFTTHPYQERNDIRASQVSGINNESVKEFIASMNMSFDFYNDFMTFYSESGFISPIAGTGLLFYRYYLEDSTIRNGHTCYRITFKPRRKQERTFIGEFWVSSAGFAIQQLTMRLNPEANVNFITELYADYDYTCLNDTLWLITREHIQADFNLAEWKNLKGLQGDKTTLYTNYVIAPQPDSMHTEETAIPAPPLSWDSLRPVKLTAREQKVYTMVDSIKNVPAFRTTYDILSTLFDAHYNMGKFKIGPYFSVYSFNEVEGHRFRIGGTTTAQLSDQYKCTAYMAYGSRDKDLKYYANLIYIFSASPRMALTTVYRHDVSQINVEPSKSLNENILSSFMRRNPFTKLQMINNFNTSLEADVTEGITSALSINYLNVFPSAFIPIVKANGARVAHISSTEVGLNFHVESGQKFFKSRFKRIRLRNDNPSFDIGVSTALKNVFSNHFHYLKLKLSIHHYLKTSPIGFNRIAVEAAKTSGQAPWPLLFILQGNETYGLNKNCFNMMNFYEFVASEYISVVSEQHFQGIILNYIPLLRKLKLREVAEFKAVAGRMRKNFTAAYPLPPFMHGLSQPYIETGIGVENIFKVLRIDALWRLSYLRNHDIEMFGLRARLQFML